MLLSRAPRVRDVVLKGNIRVENGEERLESLILNCPNIRLLDIKDTTHLEKIEVKTKKNNKDLIVVQNERNAQIDITYY